MTDLDNGSIVVLEDNKDLNVINLLNSHATVYRGYQ